MSNSAGLGRWLIALLVGISLFVNAGYLSSAGGDVEQRIADFWKRVDALQPGDYLLSADLGQWALNVIERNPRARTTVADFRVSTGGMQAAMDRAGLAPDVPILTPAPTGSVEQRIADFWKRIDALRSSDYLLAADLGQWALNVIERNPRARTTVADFRVSSGGMQAAMDRAGLAPAAPAPVPTPAPAPTPTSTPAPVLPPGTYSLGQSAVFTSGWRLTAQSCAEQPAGYNRPDPGMRFFTCFVRFDNGASVTIHASKFDFVLQDSTGVRRDPVLGYIDRNDDFNSGDVAPGAVLAGTITFQAPIGDTKLLLIYSKYGLSQVTYRLY